MTAEPANLDLLVAADFAPLVGEVFHLSVEEGAAPVADLVLRQWAEGDQSFGERKAFSLLFEGPPDVVLDQSIYWLRHPALGLLGIFLVPVSGDAKRREYQAVFN